MITWIQQYLMYALCLVIVLLLIFTGVQTVRITNYKKDLALAQTEKKVLEGQVKNGQLVISQLAVASDELAVRLKDIQAEARRQKAKRDREHGDLSGESVPNDCQGATKWAREKTKQLSSKW